VARLGSVSGCGGSVVPGRVPLAGVNQEAWEGVCGIPAEGDDEMTSEYLSTEELDIERWVRDAIALELPAQVLCDPDCAGLCPHCGERLQAGVPHDCGEPQTDSRWDALKDLL